MMKFYLSEVQFSRRRVEIFFGVKFLALHAEEQGRVDAAARRRHLHERVLDRPATNLQPYMWGAIGVLKTLNLR